MSKYYLMLTFVIYFILCSLVMVIKPKMIFQGERAKKFGTNSKDTILPLWIVFIMIGIISYFTSIIINLKFL